MNDFTRKASKYNFKDDDFLFEECKNSKIYAYKELFYKYYNSMYSYGTKLSNDNELIIDTIQDVFTFLWESRNKLKNITSIKAYLFKIFRNRIFNQKSKYKNVEKFAHDNYDLLTNFEISHEDIIINEENELQKTKIINLIYKELTTRQREILFLKFYCNMTNVEISKLLTIEIQSVSNLLNRTITTLRKKLKKSDLFYFCNPLIIGILNYL